MSVEVTPTVRPIWAQLGNALSIFAALVFLIVLWQLSIMVFKISPGVLPQPNAVFHSLVDQGSFLWQSASSTAVNALTGLALSILLGIPLGWVLAQPSRIQAALSATTLAAQIFPKIALAPLFVVWLGFGIVPKVLYIFWLGFFPVMINAAAGFSSMPTDLRDLAVILKMKRLQRLWNLELPFALPSIFTGVKISASFAMTAAIVYEFVGSSTGIGYTILQTQINLNTKLMFAGFIVVALIGFAIYGVVAGVERFAIPWHVSRR
jgi:NitT/TauT family transport system permease protein